MDIATESLRSIVRNSEIQPSWLEKPLPRTNEKYLPANEIVKNAKNIYKSWYQDGLVEEPLYITKSPIYLGMEDLPPDLAKFAYDLFNTYIQILASDMGEEEKKYQIETLRRTLPGTFSNQMRDILDNTETKRCSPFRFANHDIYDFEYLVDADPGCGILERAEKRDGGLSLENFDKEVKDVWKWVDEWVEKNGEPMGLDLFVAGLCVFNHGDMRKAYLDATIITKLVRNDPTTYVKFINIDDFSVEGQAAIKNNIQDLNRRLKDQFALCVSSNWIGENIGFDDRVFQKSTDDDWREWKFMDAEAASGDIYHGLNLTILPTVIDIRLIPMLLLGEYYYYAENHGVEKMFADINVVMRSAAIERELRNI